MSCLWLLSHPSFSLSHMATMPMQAEIKPEPGTEDVKPAELQAQLQQQPAIISQGVQLPDAAAACAEGVEGVVSAAQQLAALQAQLLTAARVPQGAEGSSIAPTVRPELPDWLRAYKPGPTGMAKGIMLSPKQHAAPGSQPTVAVRSRIHMSMPTLQRGPQVMRSSTTAHAPARNKNKHWRLFEEGPGALKVRRSLCGVRGVG